MAQKSFRWRLIRAGSLTFVLALALALATGSVALAAEKVTITFWHAMGGPLGDSLNDLVAAFNATHPDIEVKSQYQGNYGALNQKILAAVAAKKPPTVAQVYSNWTDQLVEAGALAPMEDFIPGPGGLTDKEYKDIVPVFRSSNTFDGKFFTMPFNKSLYVMFYNVDALRDKELKPPANWKQLLEVAKALTVEKDGKITRYGFALRPNGDYFALFFFPNGGKWLSDDGKKAAFNSKAGVEALQFMVDLVHKYKVAYYIPGYLDQDFAAGKTAIYFTSTPGRPYAEKAVAGKFKVGIAPIPYSKSKSTPVAGTDLAIFAAASKAEQTAGWEFVKFLTNTENTAKFSIASYYLPVRQSAIESDRMKKYFAGDPYNKVGVNQLPYAVFDPPKAAWNKIRNYISDAVEKALLLKATPKEALDEAVAKANQELARSR